MTDRSRRPDADDAHSPLSRRDLVRLGAVGVGAAMVGSPAALGDARAQISTQPGQIPTWSGAGVLDRGSELGSAPAARFAAAPIPQVRIGFVGTGLQGTAHVGNLTRGEGCVVTALCDTVPANAERAAAVVQDAGFPRPTLYTAGETDFLRLCEREDLDLVYTATPWRWHVPVCLAAMENGKHAASEVPIAVTVEDCWRLVEAAEKHQRHCVMMENVCYGRNEMMVLNMVRQGVLGEILHGECGYMHDLRAIKFEDVAEGMWRRAHSMVRNGNLYPTHGLGPMAQYMNINRGDRFDYLVSMSSPSRGLQEFAAAHFPEGDPKRSETYALGDVNTSLIKTVNGKTIILGHDTNLPRPYDRMNMVQGTGGIAEGWPDRVYVEGRSPAHRWEEAATYLAEFDHPLWRQLEEASAGAGHGGMDYIEDWRLITCLRDGVPTDADVYDAVALSAVCEISERSVAAGSAPFPFPDFTRGRWREYEPLGIVGA